MVAQRANERRQSSNVAQVAEKRRRFAANFHFGIGQHMVEQRDGNFVVERDDGIVERRA